jgi:hypothetical protein
MQVIQTKAENIGEELTWEFLMGMHYAPLEWITSWKDWNSSKIQELKTDCLINSMKATLFNQCNLPAKFYVSSFFEISGYRTRVTIVQFLNFQTFNNHVNWNCHHCAHFLVVIGDLATWDRPIFLDKRSNRCQVASPVWRGSKKSSALLFSALHRFFCIALRLVAATCKRILANLGTSASLTVSEMELQFSTCEYGRAMLSAMMTGTHPNTTDSTIRGLHGAQPNGHRQKMDLRSSSW